MSVLPASPMYRGVMFGCDGLQNDVRTERGHHFLAAEVAMFVKTPSTSPRRTREKICRGVVFGPPAPGKRVDGAGYVRASEPWVHDGGALRDDLILVERRALLRRQLADGSAEEDRHCFDDAQPVHVAWAPGMGPERGDEAAKRGDGSQGNSCTR